MPRLQPSAIVMVSLRPTPPALSGLLAPAAPAFQLLPALWSLPRLALMVSLMLLRGLLLIVMVLPKVALWPMVALMDTLGSAPSKPRTGLTMTLLVLLATVAIACGSSKNPEVAAETPLAERTRIAQVSTHAHNLDAAADSAESPACGSIHQLAPGLIWQTVPASKTPSVSAGDRCIRLLRIDPAHYDLRILTAGEHGQARGAPTWAKDFDLTAVINTSMYRPSGRSTGMLLDAKTVNNSKDTRKFGAFLAFDPAPGTGGGKSGKAPVALFGRGCAGFDLDVIRSQYRAVVQNYRLLDCEGKAIVWKDPKIYSAAAVAIDERDHIVFIHLRTPYLMSDFTEMLAAQDLGLRAAMYVEGGPEASLYVHAGGFQRSLVGSYESEFQEHDDNRVSWPLPNVLGIVPRAAAPPAKPAAR